MATRVENNRFNLGQFLSNTFRKDKAYSPVPQISVDPLSPPFVPEHIRIRLKTAPIEIASDEAGPVLRIGGEIWMQSWEKDLMDKSAEQLAKGGGHLLVIGGGLGIEMDATLSKG